VPIPIERAATLDLGQPPERFELELIDDAPDLGEVLLDPRIGQLGERFAAQRSDRRPKLAHSFNPSNMCSTLRRSYPRFRDAGHVQDNVAVR
jgi:hypothetical protein